MREASYTSFRLGLYKPLKQLFKADKPDAESGDLDYLRTDCDRETTKKLFIDVSCRPDSPFILKFAAGGASGGLGSVVGNPFDILKTKMMASETGLGLAETAGSIFANQGDYDAEANTIWLNDGYGSFSEYGSGLGDRFSTAVAIGDIDVDGDLDAVFANAYGSPNTVWFNQGTGEFIDSEARLGNSRSTSVGLDDLDGDGYLDVFFTNSGQPNTVWLNDGTGHFEEFGTGLGNQKSHAVALGDVDGDGITDFLLAQYEIDNFRGRSGGAALFLGKNYSTDNGWRDADA